MRCFSLLLAFVSTDLTYQELAKRCVLGDELYWSDTCSWYLGRDKDGDGPVETVTERAPDTNASLDFTSAIVLPELSTQQR